MTCSKMLNFWTLSAIAAFCLGEVLSVNFGGPLGGQTGGLPPFGGSPGGSGGLGVPNRGGLKSPSNPEMPQIQIGDDEIRIACITFNLSTDIFF